MVRVAEEQIHQLVLLIVQHHSPSPAGKLVPVAVQLRAAQRENGRGVSLVPPGEGLHPGHKFAGGEGLGQVVVRPGVQPGNPVFNFPLGGQKKHRGGHAPAAGLLQYRQAVHAGHHNVQHNGVVGRKQNVVQGVCTVVDHIHRIFVSFQDKLERPRNLHLVLCDEDTHGGIHLL